jgi:hypothetical protein
MLASIIESGFPDLCHKLPITYFQFQKNLYTVDSVILYKDCVVTKPKHKLESETDFHIFVRGGGINIWGVLLLALAGAWWQRPERPRKKFNKICFLGLHGEI